MKTDFKLALTTWSKAHAELVKNELLFADLLIQFSGEPEKLETMRAALRVERQEVDAMLTAAMAALRSQ